MSDVPAIATQTRTVLEEIVRKLDREAEKLRVFRDAARLRGETDAAAGFADRAAGYEQAAKIIRERIP